jgi:hypothetical protein
MPGDMNWRGSKSSIQPAIFDPRELVSKEVILLIPAFAFLKFAKKTSWPIPNELITPIPVNTISFIIYHSDRI